MIQELPNDELCVIHLTGQEAYIGRKPMEFTLDKSLARVFANERAAMQYYSRTELNEPAELETIKSSAVCV